MIYGRQEIKEKEELIDCTNFRPSLLSEHHHIICQRCGMTTEISQVMIESSNMVYCPHCIQFGRVTSKNYLVWQNSVQRKERSVIFNWPGTLTTAQAQISRQLIANYISRKDSLVWAVTGAGKTEMIFPIIHQVLERGGRVAMCSPRIDVCRELYPRIVEAFPEENPLLLHGNSEERYRYSHLLICTMHQLIYFYQAFDLLIVDEADAFPYEGNKLLFYSRANAISQRGRCIYLTATPSQFLLKNLREQTEILKLPSRFHGRPLPVPKVVFFEQWTKPTHPLFKWQLVKLIKQLLGDCFVLVFCPTIQYMKTLEKMLSHYFSAEQLVSIYSADSERKEKVLNTRQRQYQVVLTTMILERGVTFERVSVIVLGANHTVYSKSALVQIAGRVDRKGAETNGRVFFVTNRQTTQMRQAIREIKEMNDLAKRISNNHSIK